MTLYEPISRLINLSVSVNFIDKREEQHVKNLNVVWPISKNGCVELMQLKNMQEQYDN